MHRKIHNVKIVGSNFVDLDGSTIEVSDTVTVVISAIEPSGIQFARRQIANAEKYVFNFTPGGTVPARLSIGKYIDGYIANPGTQKEVWLCPVECRKLLGVGKKTKKFSLWVRPVEM